MPIRSDNPREVGADRIVNAVAAYEKYRRELMAVDLAQPPPLITSMRPENMKAAPSPLGSRFLRKPSFTTRPSYSEWN